MRCTKTRKETPSRNTAVARQCGCAASGSPCRNQFRQWVHVWSCASRKKSAQHARLLPFKRDLSTMLVHRTYATQYYSV